MKEKEKKVLIVLWFPSLFFRRHPYRQFSSQSYYSKFAKMISNILPIVALAGIAMAACPISVEIAGATDHIAHVAVTNTGTEAVTIFKGNTVFSEHTTKDLLVADAGKLNDSL